MTATARGDGWLLACGRWQDVTPECLEVDALITDPPYSERTHGGQASIRDPLRYSPWDTWELDEALPHVRGWACVITDHVCARGVEERMLAHDRCVFAPVPIVSLGGRVRLAGDGPSSWTVWMVVSRPRGKKWARWGTLPGAYIERGSVKDAPIVGAKQLSTMRAIVRDYTRPGDTVWDPYAGTGTTLLAAVIEGRKAVGAEMDPDTWAYAVERLRAWDRQPRLPGVMP